MLPLLKKEQKVSILLRIPSSLKKELVHVAEKGNVSKYILDTIRRSIEKERLSSWFEDYVKSDKVLRVKPVSRKWPVRKLYASENP